MPLTQMVELLLGQEACFTLECVDSTCDMSLSYSIRKSRSHALTKALTYAGEAGNREVVSLLLSRGARPRPFAKGTAQHSQVLRSSRCFEAWLHVAGNMVEHTASMQIAASYSQF